MKKLLFLVLLSVSLFGGNASKCSDAVNKTTEYIKLTKLASESGDSFNFAIYLKSTAKHNAKAIVYCEGLIDKDSMNSLKSTQKKLIQAIKYEGN